MHPELGHELYVDGLPVDIEFFRDELRERGGDALPHLVLGDRDGHTTVDADTHPHPDVVSDAIRGRGGRRVTVLRRSRLRRRCRSRRPGR